MAVITYPRRRQAAAAGGVRFRIEGLLTFLITSAAALGLISLTLATLVTTQGYEVRRLQAEQARWTEQTFRLETEISSLQALDRVEREARSRLKLAEARDRLFINPAGAPAPPPPAPGTPASREPGLFQLALDQLAWLRLLLQDAAAGLP